MSKVLELKPVAEPKAEYDEVEQRIRRAFRELVFLPLMRELALPPGTLLNAASPLLEAIRTGRVTFTGANFSGRFTGQFNAQITKELKALGAVWDKRSASFTVATNKLPLEIRAAISAGNIRFQEKLAAIDLKLAQILPAEIAKKIKLTEIFDTTLWKVERGMAATLSAISVPPQLSDEARRRIVAEYQSNMEKSIVDFATDEIIKLRKAVQASVFSGNRYESLVRSIQTSYGVSASKAKFLARQETGLMVAKFKETRYADAGVHEYKWACVAGSKNHPVRPSHKRLEGKIFRWDNPPITTEPGEPVRRNNPKEDYNCRCLAIPIVRFKE